MTEQSSLSDQEYLRYSQHLLLEDIGERGQLRFRQARVLIIGLGGLGCAAAQYLAGAGVGQLWLADFDVVELSNLQRQVLYNSDSIQQSKAELARENLSKLNPHIELISVNQKMTAELLPDFVSQVDLVLDCSDNLDTRLAVNQACVDSQVPLVSGAAIGLQGQLLTFSTEPGSACYQCVFPQAQRESQNCRNSGILSPIVGIVGSVQALQALKILGDLSDCQFNQLHRFDGRTLSWQSIHCSRLAHCPACGSQES